MSTTNHTNDGHANTTAARRITTETKSSYKTTELIAYVVAVIGVLVASALTDASDFGTQEAWFYVTLLTIGYMVSRGLAKSGVAASPSTRSTTRVADPHPPKAENSPGTWAAGRVSAYPTTWRRSLLKVSVVSRSLLPSPAPGRARAALRTCAAQRAATG